MAISLRATPRRGHVQYLFIAAAIAAAAVAVLPIAFAVIGGGETLATPRSAFASAPSGEYAVVARTQGDTDVISVVRPDDPAHAMEIARVKHLDGYSAVGAVAPGGTSLALAVPDSGTATQPLASLVIVDLDAGTQQTLSKGLDPLARPVWAPDGSAVVVTRTVAAGNGLANVEFVRVPAHGGDESTLFTADNVLGAYGVGFDAQGRFISVNIDGSGSSVERDGTKLESLSTQITRDWQLSPDGTQLAFIESNLTGGLHYDAKTVSLDGSPASVTAEGQGDGSQQLGVAWKPGAAAATFGGEQPVTLAGGVQAQTADDGVTGGAGFDVPIAYSGDGSALAVDHWTGSGFANAGTSTLQLVSESGARASLNGYARFFGWSAR